MTLEADVLELQRKAALQETLPMPIGGGSESLSIRTAGLSSATLVAVLTNHGAINYADAATQGAYWNFTLPPGWETRTLTVKILWAPSTTNAGNCLWSCSYFSEQAGVTMSATADETDTLLQAASGTADRPQAATVASFVLALAAGSSFSLLIQRIGADGTDTFTGAARLVSVELSVTG